MGGRSAAPSRRRRPASPLDWAQIAGPPESRMTRPVTAGGNSSSTSRTPSYSLPARAPQRHPPLRTRVAPHFESPLRHLCHSKPCHLTRNPLERIDLPSRNHMPGLDVVGLFSTSTKRPAPPSPAATGGWDRGENSRYTESRRGHRFSGASGHAGAPIVDRSVITAALTTRSAPRSLYHQPTSPSVSNICLVRWRDPRKRRTTEGN